MLTGSLVVQVANRTNRPSVRQAVPKVATPPVVDHTRCDFFKAITDGALDQVIALASRDPSLLRASTTAGLTPLGLAAFLGHVDVMDFLLDHDIPADFKPEYGQTALACSVMRGQTAIVRYLLERGADIDARQAGGFTPLHAAAQIGDVEMVRTLLDYHPDINARHAEGGTALTIALEWGHAEAATLLRQHGAA